jgi:hypothetical protein
LILTSILVVLCIKILNKVYLMINEILTHEDLFKYLKELNFAQGFKSQEVLKIILSNPNGINRCCLRSELISKGIDIGQIAAQVRELRNAGINIPKSKKRKCTIHNRTDTVDKIDYPYITGNDYARAKYTPKEISSIRKILDRKDSFTQIRVTTNPEIDHRIPVARMLISDESFEKKVDVSNVAEVKNQYQLLSRDNNLYKSRVCEKCISSNKKPDKFLGIKIPEKIGGGLEFVKNENDCISCPFAYPEKFLEKVAYGE